MPTSRPDGHALDVLLQLSDAVARAGDVAVIYDEALSGLIRALGADRASILLYDSDGVMRFKAWRGLSDLYRAAVEGHSPWTPDAVDPLPIVVPDVLADRDLAGYADLFRDEGIRALAFIPLVYRGLLIGKFMAYYAEPRALTDEDVQIARIIASHVAFAVERRRAEEKLLLYREVFAHANEGIAIVDQRGHYLEQNESHRLLMGYSDAELAGRTPAIHLGEGAFAEIAGALAARGRFRGERVSRTREGAALDIELSAFAVRDEAGAPVCFVGIKRNITEQKRTEARLRLTADAGARLASSLDYTTTLLNAVHVGVPEVAGASAVMVRSRGSEPDELLTNHLDATRADTVKDFVRRALADEAGVFAQALRAERAVLVPRLDETHLPATGGDGTLRDLLAELVPGSTILAPLVLRGQTLGLLVWMATPSGQRHDAADLAMAQEIAHRAAIAIESARLFRDAQGASRTKDEFLAILSHELRSPITAMLGWARLLRSGRLDADRSARAVETIERNALAQARLIEDLLDLSRIVTGKLRLDRRPVELRALVARVVDSWRPAAEAKELRFELALDAAGELADVDPERLEQVVSNLLSNAVKFSERGGSITVALARRGGELHIAVSDQGRGIRAEFLPFVFDRFRQADASASRAADGLGLGLAIVRHLVALHGGRAYAESAGEGRGARFTISLPAAEAPLARSVHQPPRMTDLSTVALAGVRVLVVDDQADARELVQTVLEGFGAEVTCASSAGEAMRALDLGAPDVLVSDIAMPGEDGLALVTRLRRDHRFRRLPAIALTAYASVDDCRRALSAGFNLHVPKPVEPAELAHTIAQLARPVS